MENDELSKPVHTRQEFAAMVMKLREGLLLRPEGWENVTLPEYLEAMAAYAQDIDGYYRNVNIDQDADKASWQRFADILMGASIYE